MNRIHWSLLVICIGVGSEKGYLFASVGMESASFLDIPTGAAPASLGGAYVARASNVYGTAWNPAGLANAAASQLTGQHLDYLEGIHYEFAATAVPLRPGSTLGAAIQYLGSGNVTGMSETGAPTGDFSNHYSAYSLAFGQVINDAISLGVTGKWIEAQLSDVHANSYAADLGAFFRPAATLSVAAVLANVGPPLSFIDHADPLPMAGHLGLLYTPLTNWSFSLDGIYRRNGLASAHSGIEWRPMQALTLRAGYRTDTLRELSPLAGFTTGIGLMLFGQELAYAWVPMGALGNSQYLSFVLTFGPNAADRKNFVYLSPDGRRRTAWSPPATVRDSAPRPSTVGDPERDELSDLLAETEVVKVQ